MNTKVKESLQYGGIAGGVALGLGLIISGIMPEVYSFGFGISVAGGVFIGNSIGKFLSLSL